MVKLTARKPAALALALVAAAVAFNCQKKSSNDFSQVVPVNRTSTTNVGDSITIDEVRGPSTKWTVGSTYEVKGTYKLASRDKATLGAFVTASGPQSEGPVSPEQVMEVSKGEGQFKLRFRLRRYDGCPIGATCGPHVGFYPVPGGESFLSAYI